MAEAKSSESSVIVSRQYCSPQSVQLKIIKKTSGFTDGKFIITDMNDNLVFEVNSAFFTLHSRRTLHDASGNPVVTLYGKIMTMHDRWKIYKGESTKADDLLFSVRQSSMFRWKWKFCLDVFLANNGVESVCDFKVEVGWFKKSFVVYSGVSSTIVAKMEKKNGSFIVTMEPDTDSAFMSSLIVVLDYFFVTYSTKKTIKGVINTVDPTGFINLFWS